jgi:hypothetical protein
VAFFLLSMAHGPNWDESRGIREQDEWDAHARFMDALVDDAFVVLGGPVGDRQRVMLVVEADDEAEIEQHLCEDPWQPMGVLRIGSIEPWSVWLDGTGRAASAGSD